MTTAADLAASELSEDRARIEPNQIRRTRPDAAYFSSLFGRRRIENKRPALSDPDMLVSEVIVTSLPKRCRSSL